MSSSQSRFTAPVLAACALVMGVGLVYRLVSSGRPAEPSAPPAALVPAGAPGPGLPGPRAQGSAAERAPVPAPAGAPAVEPSASQLELSKLGLAMKAPSGFEPRISGEGMVVAPPGPMRDQPTFIAVHPAKLIEDPSIYTQSVQLPNGATVRYRAVEHPDAQPAPAIELQGLMDLGGQAYFVSCRTVAQAPGAPLPPADWCLKYVATLARN